MFGKGIYFADSFAKSKAYASQGNSSQYILLCEVALGKIKQIKDSRDFKFLEDEYKSVLGLGESGPDYNQSIILPNGVVVPIGDHIYYEKDIKEKTRFLQHNEYVVYNETQVRMRYIIQLGDAKNHSYYFDGENLSSEDDEKKEKEVDEDEDENYIVEEEEVEEEVEEEEEEVEEENDDNLEFD